MDFDIWGSCVSRDFFEFSSDLVVKQYLARQSIVSAVAPPVSNNLLSDISFAEGTHPFHKRLVLDDLEKNSVSKMRSIETRRVLVVDLIEERVPLAETTCGTVVTFSQAAQKFSNIRKFLVRYIKPFSDEFGELFLDALPSFAASLCGYEKIVIHRGLYAPGDWEFEAANDWLKYMYDRIALEVPSAISIEASEDERIANIRHKWGAAPYHYEDAYYRGIIKKLASSLGVEFNVRRDFSLSKV